jgi:hypothetical protein
MSDAVFVQDVSTRPAPRRRVSDGLLEGSAKLLAKRWEVPRWNGLPA